MRLTLKSNAQSKQKNDTETGSQSSSKNAEKQKFSGSKVRQYYRTSTRFQNAQRISPSLTGKVTNST